MLRTEQETQTCTLLLAILKSTTLRFYSLFFALSRKFLFHSDVTFSVFLYFHCCFILVVCVSVSYGVEWTKCNAFSDNIITLRIVANKISNDYDTCERMGDVRLVRYVAIIANRIDGSMAWLLLCSLLSYITVFTIFFSPIIQSSVLALSIHDCVSNNIFYTNKSGVWRMGEMAYMLKKILKYKTLYVDGWHEHSKNLQRAYCI